MATDSKNNRMFIWLIFLAVLSASAIVIAVVPSARNWARSFVISDQRQIISKVESSISVDGPMVTVLKLKKADHLIVEIYKTDTHQMLLKEELNDLLDGQMIIHGNSSSLAVSDIDGDGISEVLVPTFDSRLAAQIIVYKYNPELQIFSRMSPAN